MVNCWCSVEAVVVSVLSHAGLGPSQGRSRRVVETLQPVETAGRSALDA